MSKLLCVIATVFAANTASAGVMLQPAQLSPSVRQQVAAEITQARRVYPKTFVVLDMLREQLPVLDRNKRGRILSISKALKSLGTEGVPAMLNELAFGGKPRGTLTQSAWDGWRISLLEAVGSLRDGRAANVLSAALKHADGREFWITRAAAQALGRLGDLNYAAELLAHITQDSTKRVAVISALGDFRRTTIARALANLVDTESDPQTVALLLKALGRNGNAWAWRTKVIARTGEGDAVREIVADAAFRAFVIHAKSDWLRDRAMKAILVTAAPSTQQRIGQLKLQHPELRQAVEKLERRFVNSPIR